jgi:DNA-directed RNA polymerase specialized sigma24 family protein
MRLGRRVRPKGVSVPTKKGDGRPSRDETVLLLEFVAGLLALPADATETQRIAVAARVGLSVEATARVFGKTQDAATKALQRARKK